METKALRWCNGGWDSQGAIAVVNSLHSGPSSSPILKSGYTLKERALKRKNKKNGRCDLYNWQKSKKQLESNVSTGMLDVFKLLPCIASVASWHPGIRDSSNMKCVHTTHSLQSLAECGCIEGEGTFANW